MKQHERSETRIKCSKKRVHHQKNATRKKVQHENSATWGKVQHEKSEMRKKIA